MNIALDISPTDTGIPIPLPSERDERAEALAQRYSRKPLPPLTFEFTRDPAYLHQYYRLRENEFNSVMGLTNYSGAENDYDRKGHLMVVRAGNLVVGGARINVKSPRRHDLLPVEIGSFRLEDHFPQLRHKQLSYGQACTFSLLPEFRGGDVSYEMVKRVCSKAAALNLSVLFAASPKLNTRLYRQACISIGLKDTKVHPNIELPPHKYMEEVKLFLLSIPLDKAFTRTSVGFAPGIKDTSPGRRISVAYLSQYEKFV